LQAAIIYLAHVLFSFERGYVPAGTQFEWAVRRPVCAFGFGDTNIAFCDLRKVKSAAGIPDSDAAASRRNPVSGEPDPKSEAPLVIYDIGGTTN